MWRTSLEWLTPAYCGTTTTGSEVYDLVLPEALILAPGEYARVDTGVTARLPAGTFLQFFPQREQSGLYVVGGTAFYRRQYPSNIKVTLLNMGRSTVSLERGSRAWVRVALLEDWPRRGPRCPLQ